MYADIMTLNPFTGLVKEFDILHENTTIQGVKYDYRSVMHLGVFAFSMGNLQTIVPLKSPYPFYGTKYPTALDIFHVNILYCAGNEYIYILAIHRPYTTRSPYTSVVIL